MAHSDKPTQADTPLSKLSDSQTIAENRVRTEQKEAELTDLEHEAQSIINNGQPAIDPNSTENLSHYGLQNSKDVITFLRSPEGKSLLAEINDQIALHKAMREQQQIQTLEHASLMHRLRAALFLWVIEEQSASAHQLKDFVLKQTEKAIRDSGKSATPATQTPEYQHLAKAIADYDKAILKNQTFIDHITNQNAVLNQQLEQLTQEREALQVPYDTHTNSVDEFNTFIRDPQNRGVVLENRIADIQNEIERNSRAAQALLNNDENGENEEEARQILLKNNALNLKLGIYHDMMEVVAGTKHYVNIDGERVDSPDQAHFVLPTEQPELQQRIVKSGEKFYILRPGEDLNSEAVKDQAEKRFNQRKPEMLVVKQLIENIFGAPLHAHTLQISLVQNNISANNDVLAKALAHNFELQTSRSIALTQLNKLELTAPVPVPSPSPAVSMGHFAASAPRPSPWNAYNQKLITLSQKDKGTIGDLQTLASLAPPAYQNRINAYLTSEQKLVNLNDPRNTPVPYQKMQTLLRNMAYMGIDPTNPAVSNLKSALVLAKSAAVLGAQPAPKAVAPEPEERSKTAPTPFSMDPFKGG